jgi:hypothetical protein
VQNLLIRHLLDAMHCEKNLCENLVKTTFGHKDSYGSRQDMESQGIKRGLWLRPSNNRKEVFNKPKAPYILNYVGAIHKCVEEGKLRYMKSHDFHVLMQEVRFPKRMTYVNVHAVVEALIIFLGVP